jgi:hypothetical protein
MTIVRNDIAASSDLNSLPNSDEGHSIIATLYNALSAPAIYVWRADVGKPEIISVTTTGGTAWSWTVYINRSQGERDAWREMFGVGSVDFNLTNVRQAINDIFSGAAPASTQRAHVFAVATRQATRIEALLSTGTGTIVSPSVMSFQGPILKQDIDAILAV